MIEIPLTQNQVALIDDEDFELVSRYKWYARWAKCTKSFYAVTTVREKSEVRQKNKKTMIYMHRLILGAINPYHVDHIDHITLNNRKKNLRLADASQNQLNRTVQKNNTSGHKGVSWDKGQNKWAVHITVNGKSKKIGRFATMDQAITAYENSATIHYGQFVCF